MARECEKRVGREEGSGLLPCTSRHGYRIRESERKRERERERERERKREMRERERDEGERERKRHHRHIPDPAIYASGYIHICVAVTDIAVTSYIVHIRDTGMGDLYLIWEA